jgi:hypothetical protein
MTELSAIVELAAARLGALEGEPVPLSGGITNHNFRVRFGGRETVLRIPGKDTALLGISRDAERLAAERAAELGIAPALLDAGEDHLVCELIEGGPIDGDRLRARPQSAARALRAFHDCGLQLPVRFWVPDLLDRYAEIVGERGGCLPPSPSPATTTCCRATSWPATATPIERCWSTGSTPGWAIGCSTSATSRSTTSSTTPPRSDCWLPTSAGTRPTDSARRSS